jgi:molybdate transport system ATP-binding protein
MPALEVVLRQLHLQRGSRRILRAVNWQLRAGQRWVLVGGNGAGKTQLLKIVAGAVWPDPPARGERPSRRYRWRGRWHDDTLDVLAHIAYLGPERQDRYARYDWNFSVADLVATGLDRVDIPERALDAARRRKVQRILRSLGVEHLAEQRILEISSGERRLVLLARALASRPALLLLDETLTHLDAQNEQRLRRWFAATPRSGPAWVLSTHRRDHIPESATHALVLRNGRVVAAGALRLAAVQDALAQVLGRPAGSRTARAVPAAARGRPRRTLLAVRGGELWLEGRLILRDIDLRLRAGECWVLAGPNGSGKTMLLRALYGDFPFALGSRVTRTGVRPGEALQNFRLRCGLVAPQLQTDYPRQSTVLETVVSGWQASYGLNEAPDTAALAAAAGALKVWRLASWSRRRLAELSYGQVRRVLFARAWIRVPQVLLLDEPFAGLDARQRALIARRIEQARAGGAAILMACHHRDEWPVTCTGVLRIDGQRLVRER